jgi:hypothetical protein
MMRAVSLAIAITMGLTLAGSAYAQKGNDDNPGRGHGHDGGSPGKAVGAPPQASGSPPGKGGGAGHADVVVAPRDRDLIKNYYRTEYAAGNCPPGLAKKNNGCLPPGQAKKMWVIGQPLPANVVYYPLPPVLLGQLSPAPAGYQYVQVANDILLMAVGTRLIASALADLSSF